MKDVTAKERAFAEAHLSMPVRVHTVSMRLLWRHAEYCERWADIMEQEALGNKTEAMHLWFDCCEEFGKYEFEMERYYDHGFAMICLQLFFPDYKEELQKQGEST